MREAGMMLPLYQTKRKLKVKDLLGWELTKEDEGFGSEKKERSGNSLESFDSLEEKIAYKNKEVADLFDSFD